MTLHITGEEFRALIMSIVKMSFDEFCNAVDSDELWISVRKVDGEIYKTVITNEMAKFQD